MKINTPKSGYPYFFVFAHPEFGRCKIPAHRFAAYCFYRKELFVHGKMARHLDGDKNNISRNNIVLGDGQENHFDIPNEKRQEKWKEIGRNVGISSRRFSETEVEGIRELISKGIPDTQIARCYSVDRSTIRRIRTNSSYQNQV
jgi:hypothetical protein